MPLLTYIPEILEEHFEELAFLLHLRAAQIGSGKMLYWQFIDLDDRLTGHIDGLLAVPEGTRGLAEPALGEEDPFKARAAAYILLAMGHEPAIEKTLALLANPAVAEAMVEALLLRRQPAALPGLKKLATSVESPLMAALAMMVLAEHAPRDVNVGELARRLSHADAVVRAAAWRAAGRLPDPRPMPQYKSGCFDQAPAVRDSALLAAAWSGAIGQPVALEACRPFLRKLTPESLVPLRLLAILSPAGDPAVIAELAKPSELAAARFDLLACTGSPAVIPHLLSAMRQPDPASAAAADAFSRLVNYLPPSKGRATIIPPGAKPDAFEKEFLPDVNLPDADAAEKYWNSMKGSLGQAPRIARGQAVEPPPANLLNVDCAAREAVLLRHCASPDLRPLANWTARWGFPQRAANT